MLDDKASARSTIVDIPVDVPKQYLPETLPDGITLLSPDKLDHRTDAEIAAWLQKRHPVTSEKNIWGFWHNGFANMKPWTQRNVINWVRRLGPEWTVHIVDRLDGSETNVLNYVEESYFPKAFLEGTMDGHKAHMGDLVRLPLLWKYGGVWMDVGLILLRHVDDICWKRIEDPESPYELSAVALMHLPGTYTPLNGFLGTKSGNPFIKRWHNVYLALWEDGVTNATGFHKHPLLRHLPLFKPDMSTVNLEDDVNFDPVFFSDYVAHYLCGERIRKLVDPNDGFNGPEWYDKHMLIFDAADEMLYAQIITKWDVEKQFRLLSLKRSGEGAVVNEQWHEAEEFVNTLLAKTAMLKFPHGPGGEGLKVKMLADLWDADEYRDRDHEEGTFAAYLRYGSLQFDQTREVKKLEWQNPKEETFTVGYLEPVQQ
ncbi:hypothetical protein TgHK011_003493 [Trichoderma gracile]|nr:hypothetical protein TgHK011_003493 [Trichoderma gracile]